MDAYEQLKNEAKRVEEERDQVLMKTLEIWHPFYSCISTNLIISNPNVGGGLLVCLSVCYQVFSENTAFFVWSNAAMERTLTIL